MIFSDVEVYKNISNDIKKEIDERLSNIEFIYNSECKFEGSKYTHILNGHKIELISFEEYDDYKICIYIDLKSC